jgi:carotenoid cleavage dioxygenase
MDVITLSVNYFQIGDLKGFFGLFMVQMQQLRKKFKVLDFTYGYGTGTTSAYAVY